MKYLAIAAMLVCVTPAFADLVDSQQAISDSEFFINGTFRATESSVTCKSTGKGGFRMTVANSCADPAETTFATISLNKQTQSIEYNVYHLDVEACGERSRVTDDLISLKDYRNAKRGVAKLCRTTLRAME